MLNDSLWSMEVAMFEEQRRHLREAEQRALVREAQAGRKQARLRARQKDGCIERQRGSWVARQAERVAAAFWESQARTTSEPC